MRSATALTSSCWECNCLNGNIDKDMVVSQKFTVTISCQWSLEVRLPSDHHMKRMVIFTKKWFWGMKSPLSPYSMPGKVKNNCAFIGKPTGCSPFSSTWPYLIYMLYGENNPTWILCKYCHIKNVINKVHRIDWVAWDSIF